MSSDLIIVMLLWIHLIDLTEVAREVFSASVQVTVEATEVIFVVRVVTCSRQKFYFFFIKQLCLP